MALQTVKRRLCPVRFSCGRRKQAPHELEDQGLALFRLGGWGGVEMEVEVEPQG